MDVSYPFITACFKNLNLSGGLEDRDDFRAMSRSLQNDLRLLGHPTANPLPMTRKPSSQGSQLGAAYVIRGLRLGANVLRPRIPSQFSASYFDFVPTLSWPISCANATHFKRGRNRNQRCGHTRGKNDLRFVFAFAYAGDGVAFSEYLDRVTIRMILEAAD